MAKKKKGGEQNVWDVFGTRNELGRQDAWEIPHINLNTIIFFNINFMVVYFRYKA